ncbi:MAG: histidine kinase dimerization/phospho-acceptor domain-containing protein [Pseudomonadota bacterium]
MFFDDRLATVLRQRGDSEASVRTQYRQLLDILGNRKYGPSEIRDNSLIAAAWLRMDALAQRIPAEERAAMIRERGWRFRSADLAAHLSDFEPEVASAALNRADLTAQDWAVLIPRLPVRARGFLRLRRDLPVDVEQLLEQLGVYDRGLPLPSATGPRSETVNEEENTPPTLDLTDEVLEADPDESLSKDVDQVSAGVGDTQPEDPNETGRSEISALVERIAQFRRTRDNEVSEAELSPRLPLDEDAQLSPRRIASFGFCADAAGRIEWAEAEVAAMLIGTKLVAPRRLGSPEGESAFERAFFRRQPIKQAAVTLNGAEAIAGGWVVDGQPRFSEDGNFSGYFGRFRRLTETEGAGTTQAVREADRIRQLLHELRTPVTAVQGYAEVIQQQLFGPAPHEYRALAAAIAADAAHILAGFEELDRLARLDTGMAKIEKGDTDLAALATGMVSQLATVLGPRMAGIELDYADQAPLLVAIDQEEAEAMIWRLLATLGGGCASGESLTSTLTIDRGMARLTCEVPKQLMVEGSIFTAEAKPIAASVNAGLFGAGFTLRLARAEARSAGGTLTHEGEQVTLLLPLLTGETTLRSQSEGSVA